MSVCTYGTRAKRGVRCFVGSAGNATRNLIGFECAQESASEVGQKTKFAIAAEQFCFALRDAQVRVDARKQLAGRGRLYDVIIRTRGKGFEFATLTIISRKNNDGQLLHCRLGSQEAAQRYAVDIRHLDIEHYQVAVLLVQEPERRRRIGSNHSVVTCALKDAAQVFARAQIVINDQQRGGSWIEISDRA